MKRDSLVYRAGMKKKEGFLIVSLSYKSLDTVMNSFSLHH